jgi:hypothetical protein
MRRLIIIFFVLCAVIACGDADRVPRGVLSKEEIGSILLDMTMADALSNEVGEGHMMPVTDSVRQGKLKVYYKQILELHHVSVDQFMRSYEFYESHPNRLKEVYALMLTEAGKRKAEQEKLELANMPVDPNLHKYFPNSGKSVISAKGNVRVPFKPKD